MATSSDGVDPNGNGKRGWTSAPHLVRCVESYGPRRWASAIAPNVPGRTESSAEIGQACNSRQHSFPPHGCIAWLMHGRLPIFLVFSSSHMLSFVCAFRYMYHLAPHLNKADWSPEEDQRIIEAVEHDGTAWAKLVQYFPGRTDNGIKNRWNTLIRKRLRHELRHTEAAAHAVAMRSVSKPG